MPQLHYATCIPKQTNKQTKPNASELSNVEKFKSLFTFIKTSLSNLCTIFTIQFSSNLNNKQKNQVMKKLSI